MINAARAEVAVSAIPPTVDMNVCLDLSTITGEELWWASTCQLLEAIVMVDCDDAKSGSNRQELIDLTTNADSKLTEKMRRHQGKARVIQWGTGGGLNSMPSL